MNAHHGKAGVFDPAAVQRVLAHLNRCHHRENVRLAQLADPPAPISHAWLAGMDDAGVDFVAESDQGPMVLRVSFEWPARTMDQAGDEMRRLYRAAYRRPQ